MLRERVPTKTNPRPLRIGIWCDYGFTLTPKAGIGVFVYNLVAGLLSLEEPIEVVMLVRPGDQAVVSPLRRSGASRLHVAPPLNTRAHWLRRAQVLRATWGRIRTAVHRLPTRGISYLAQRLRALVNRARKGNWLAILGIILGIAIAPAVFILLWVLYAGYRLAGSILAGVFYPLRILGWGLGQHAKEKIYDPVAAAQACTCDVWLIPFAGFPHSLTFPAVLVIHDLIHVHFPNTQDPQLRQITDQAFRARASEANLCACMSNFIRDHDLKEALHLPDEKIRVIRPAPPNDLIGQEPEPSNRLEPRLTRPYVFYPSDFRPHKNHQVLIEALHWVKTHLGEDGIDLVFTGMSSIPGNLTRLIQAYDLTSRVHVLGCVDRSILGALYQGAMATIVPSLYEQGSFPVYEALYWKCPVACSDIPSLREQCEPMHDAMLYFDPRDPEAVARVVLHIRENREAIADRQYAASRILWQRTWKDVARDWLTVFREAVEIARKKASSPADRTAA